MTGSLNITGGSSTLTVAGISYLNSLVYVANDLNVDSGVLFVDASSNEVGINTTNPVAALDVRGDIFLQNTNPTIYFNGTSDSNDNPATADMAIRATPEGLDFIEPEDGSKIQFRIFDDTGVDSPFGYHINGTRILNQGRNLTNMVSITIDNANDNSGAPLYFLGSNSQRNFRIGNQIGHSNAFEITPSTNNGGQNWDGTPAIYVRGDRRVAINTSAISGVDSESNTTRSYYLNVQGDMNINGQLFQNNSEFVTSRWTEASNNLDIYRLSRVGIKKQDPTYDLHVLGGVNIEGSTFSGGQNTSVLYANGVKQWIDSYGIFKANSNTVSENVTVPANVNCVSAGPITIANGYTVTINNSGNWAIV